MAANTPNESSGRRRRGLRINRASASSSQRRLAVESLEDRRMLAIDFKLIEDINDAGLPLQIGKPTNITKVGETVFFSTERVSFSEPQSLWKIDPATREAVLLKSFSPLGINNTTKFAELNGSLYFTANDGSTGFELWKSDGTAAGTVLVKDTVPGALGGGPTSLVNANGVLYFTASDRLTNASQYLWKSDGTAAGTMPVANIGKALLSGGSTLPGGTPEVQYNLTAVGDAVFFVANGVGGAELWRSDGTAAGTGLVLDIVPGSFSSSPVELTAVGDWLYFSAYDPTHGRELWRSDGTAAGTTLVKDLYPGTGSGFTHDLIEVNGTVYFRGNDGIEGAELWKTDGTAAGTVLVKSFRPDGFGGAPDMFYNWAGTLYFSAASDLGGFGLWKSDGTTAGTTLVRPVGDGGPYMDYPRDLDAGTPWAAVLDDELYFLGNYNQQLWKTDGTAAGTVPVRQLLASNIYPSQTVRIEVWMTEVGGNLFFVHAENDSTSRPQRLWTSDGTALGTVLVSAAGSGTADALEGWIQETINGVSYFVAANLENGRELWRTDGTAAGTYLVRDINPGVLGSNIYRLTLLDNVLYFSANDGASEGLWRSDGTEAGTWKVVATTTSPASPTVANGWLFYQQSPYNTGLQLWRTDGTAAGTSLVKTVSPAGSGPSSTPMVEFNGEVYFQTNDGLTGAELWKSDGTSAGTVLVQDVSPGAASSHPTNFTVAGGLLYFAVRPSGASERELWRTDGTSGGTARVGGSSAVIVPGQYDGAVFQEVNGVLYFTGDGGDGAGTELWRTDGTVAGTFRLTDILPGASSSSIFHSTNANGILLFTALDAASQWQIWRSDGTVAGTTLVTPVLSAGGTVASVNGFRQIGDDSWFTVGNSANQLELWRTDGTAAGTMLVEAIALDTPYAPTGQSPIVVGDRLVLPLRTAAHGVELWSATFVEASPLAGDFDRNGSVDGDDFLSWQLQLGAASNPYGAGADGDASGRVGGGDLDVWKENYGATASAIAATAGPASPIQPAVHDVSLHVAAPLTATIAASVVSPDEANSWPLVAERPAPQAARGRLQWFLDSPVEDGAVGRSAAFHVAARESAVFPAGAPAWLWKSETAQAWDLLARESLVAGASGLGGVSSSLRPEKSSPFDGEEIDWRLEQLFQTERLAGTDSRDEL